MSLGMSDRKYASIAALVLLGAATFIVFVIHPESFEGQIVWLFGLLPGAVVGETVTDRFVEITPLLYSITFWPFTLGTSFLWYFAISYALIKTYRFVSSYFNR
jgi:hypothetical protein